MIKTELTTRILNDIKKHYGKRLDKCGRPIIDHLIWVAEHMRDEESTCAALLQDIYSEPPSAATKITSELPYEISYAVFVLFYSEKSESFDSYLHQVLTDRIATRVKIVDLQYRSNPENYSNLTVLSIDRILLYRSCYWQMFFQSHRLYNEGLPFVEMDAIKTPCCKSIVKKEMRYCPSCGKEIDNKVAEYLRYGFDNFATETECWGCGSWMPISYRYCGRCGQRLKMPKQKELL